jgi:NAD-dependent DNA ligase
VLLSNESVQQKVVKVSAIKGMAIKTAEAFVERIPEFIQFMKEAGLTDKLYFEKQNIQSDHPLFEKTIIMTGFRDASIQDIIKKVGAKLGASVSKQTFLVIVKDNSIDDTGKVLDAKKLGIPIMSAEEFKIKYL